MNRKIIALTVVTAFFCLGFPFVMVGQNKNKVGETHAGAIYSNNLLRKWLVIGPIKIDVLGSTPSQEKQKLAFEKDDLTKITFNLAKPPAKVKVGGSEYKIKSVQSVNGTLDFAELIGPNNFSIAYAVCEIKAIEATELLLGAGSDDGVKIFLNGTLIHQNYIARGLSPNDDIVPLNLKKGINQIVVKVQNIEQGWSFNMQFLQKEQLTNMLIDAAGKGNLDRLKLLAEKGGDIHGVNGAGISAYQMAMIGGRANVMAYLQTKGVLTTREMPSILNLIDETFKNIKDSMPAVSVLASVDGKIIYEKAFGYANVENKIPATTETKFRIGSITKQFTAAAILKLQEEGKLSLQDKLSQYIPDFPRGNEVTIRNLLNHTSGIHSYTSQPNFVTNVTQSISPQALIDSIKTYPYDFNPGEQNRYNNSGFFILGYLVEKISGKSYAQYLDDTFFKPLGMKNTGVHISNLKLENEALGYSVENGVAKKAVNWDMSWAGGAGSLYSTVRDLYLWNEAVFNGKVLSEQSLHDAFSPTILNNGVTINYGYGWSIDKLRGKTFIGHGGGLHGFVSYLVRQPDSKFSVVVLCNSAPAPEGINPSTNALLISQYILWKEMEKQSDYALDTTIKPEVLKSYVGRYNYGRGAVMLITLNGSQLNAQLTGQPVFPIYPSSQDEFFWKVVEAKIKFVKDSNNVVTHIHHFQNGQEILAKKLADETPVAINTTILNKYIGKFDAGNGFTIAISSSDNRMYIQGPNLPPYELLPASETEIFMREANARINFKADSDGKVNSVIIKMDENDIPAIRIQ